jgi:small subunit ribosomal protein S6e
MINSKETRMSEKPSYKLNISAGDHGKFKGLSKLIQVDQSKVNLKGMKIGDIIKGEQIGLVGYELQITGGCDNSGFPMRKDISGPMKKKILIRKGLGYKPKRKGERRRKTMRGDEIDYDTSLVNLKIIKYGKSKFFEESAEKVEAEE